jgi:hypothetical protein
VSGVTSQLHAEWARETALPSMSSAACQPRTAGVAFEIPIASLTLFVGPRLAQRPSAHSVVTSTDERMRAQRSAQPRAPIVDRKRYAYARVIAKNAARRL